MRKTVDGACLHIQFTYATTGRNARMKENDGARDFISEIENEKER